MINNKKGLLIGILVLISGCTGGSSNKIGHISVETALDKENIIPIAIIGSGPAGSSSGVYGARANIHTVVIEGNKPGGLLTETTEVENWPGIQAEQGPAIMDGVKKQAAGFGATFLDDAIEKVDFSVWPYQLYTEEGLTLNALTVIIATGASPLKLGVTGEEENWGKGVTACAVCDAPFFKGKEVVVVGGGDSAVEEAIQLAGYASKITILVRKDHMRAAASMQDRLKEYDNITVMYNASITRINAENDHVVSVDLRNNKTQEQSLFKTDGVFLAIGHRPNSGLFKDVIGMDDHGHIILKTRTQKTSLPGVFVAGDVADNRYRQAGVASGDGIKAALDAVEFLSDIGYTTKVQQQFEDNNALFDYHAGTRQALNKVSSEQEFQDILSGTDKPVILDFYADYCPSCLQMLPLFEKAAEQFAGQALLLKVDAEEAEDLVKKYFVYKVPCMLVFKDGKLIARHTNAMGRRELYDFIEQFV